MNKQSFSNSKETLPNHIAIIPDGNRRWAASHRLPTLEGHRKGFDVAIKVSRRIRSLGISTLTLWAFSTENWNRSKKEISYLMKLYEQLVDRYSEEAGKDKINVIHLGRKDRIPESLRNKIENIEKNTEHHTRYYLNIALDYGGRDEIIRAIRKIADQEVGFNRVNEENFASLLDTKNQPHPEPDLIIRTGGERRTSGLMIWQAAYAEYLFINKYFPDLAEEDIECAIDDYTKRERRFGT